MKRRRIYTYGGQPARRNFTVAHLIALKLRFMFLVDICGESERPPGHARAFADLPSFRRRLADERRRGLREFRSAVMDGRYPDAETSVSMLPDEHLNLLESLDARPNFHS